MGVAASSLGSFAVAAIALFSAGVQFFFAFRVRTYRWGLWASGVAMATSLYSFAVFLQYNATTLGRQLAVERLQLSAILWLVVFLIGFTNGLRRQYHPPFMIGVVASGIVLTVTVWLAPGVLRPELFERRFLLTNTVYVEPGIAPLGFAIFLLATGGAAWALYTMIRELPLRGRSRKILSIGTGVWFATALNDLIGTAIGTVPYFLLEFGFLSFAMALLSLMISQHLRLHDVTLRQQRRIRMSRSNLAQQVQERTADLRAKVEEHLTTEAELRRSMADREVLVREIHHRSKNNLQIVSSLLRLAFDGSGNADINRIVQESQDRIDAMAMVHEQLYASQNLSEVDFAEYLRGLTLHLAGVHSQSEQHRSIDFDAESVFLPVDRAIPLGLWANEAITNSYRHAQQADRLLVRLQLLASRIELVIGDNGPGVPSNHELITGPQSTVNARLHLGTHLLHDLPRQLGGVLSVRNDSGLLLSLSLPLTKECPQEQ